MNRILPVEIVLVPPGVKKNFPPVEVNLVLSGEVKFHSAKGVKLFFTTGGNNISSTGGSKFNTIRGGKILFYQRSEVISFSTGGNNFSSTGGSKLSFSGEDNLSSTGGRIQLSQGFSSQF